MTSSPQQPQRWKRLGSINSLDGLARSTISLEVPEARSCREAREQSRKEMHVLNEKLASQLEKMRFLTEQNRKLTEESQGSRGRFTRETEKLRQTYDTELRQLRQLVDDCEREKADSLAKMASLQQALRTKQDQIQHLSQANQKLSQQLDDALKDGSAKETDRAILQRRLNAAEEEMQRLRGALEQSKQNNQQLHKNLDEETASRMACQSEMQTLREEMEFQRTVHEQELEELRVMSNVDHEQDRNQWRDEMQRAIRDIQTEYDQRLDKIRNEMEANYNNRLSEVSKQYAAQNVHSQQVSEENRQLKNNLNDAQKRADQLRHKCTQLEEAVREWQEKYQTSQRKHDAGLRDAERERQSAEDALNRALNELAALTDVKLNLESEIAAYRRLLEAQDSLISGTNDTRKSRISSPTPYKPKELRVRVPTYTSSQTTFPRSSKADSVNRWTDREEPSGQSVRSHLVERTVEEFLNRNGWPSTTTVFDKGSQQLSCSYSDSEKVNLSQSENYYRGQLALSECSPNGTFIEITNTGEVEINLAGWCLIRNIDQGRQITRYTLPNRIIPAHTSFRIWAAGKMSPGSGMFDFEGPYANWGTGTLVHTSLYSPDGM
ncbi:Intermediate filament protein B, variant 4 [Clonorchis sinensis]|nr:Intermediate filament protein B, variant 4 [Clonorchis sinensis]